jgi:hypothetical protein
MGLLNYVSQTKQDVSVNFAEMDAGTVVVFVNQVSGKPIASPAFAVDGKGAIDIPIAADLPTGQYYLLARNANKYVAQTVMFYIQNQN